MMDGSWRNEDILELGRFDVEGGVKMIMIDIQKRDMGGGDVPDELDRIVAVEGAGATGPEDDINNPQPAWAYQKQNEVSPV